MMSLSVYFKCLLFSYPFNNQIKTISFGNIFVIYLVFKLTRFANLYDFEVTFVRL